MLTRRRNRGGWSPAALTYLDQVCQVLDDLRPYWPLTLRQVYYQLVARQIIPNKRSEYQKLSRVLAKGRIDGEVVWEALEDRTRQHLRSGGWAGAGRFVEQERERFLVGYRRDLLASQPYALEVWVEKDALSRVCHEVAFAYCVPVVVARGFSSISYLHECRRRAVRAKQDGRQGLRILYFGDLDPSGWAMLPAMLTTLREEMNLGDFVEGIRCALTPEQVDHYGLPHSVDAMKPTDTRTPRYRKWLREQGCSDTLAVELDALSPEVLQALVRDAIETSLDLPRLERERDTEADERIFLEGIRERVDRALEEELR